MSRGPAGQRPPQPIRVGIGGAGLQQRGAAEWSGRERRSICTLLSPLGLRAAECCSLVLSDPLLAVCEVLGRLPVPPTSRPQRRGPATAPGSRSCIGPSCG